MNIEVDKRLELRHREMNLIKGHLSGESQTLQDQKDAVQKRMSLSIRWTIMMKSADPLLVR